MKGLFEPKATVQGLKIDFSLNKPRNFAICIDACTRPRIMEPVAIFYFFREEARTQIILTTKFNFQTKEAKIKQCKRNEMKTMGTSR